MKRYPNCHQVYLSTSHSSKKVQEVSLVDHMEFWINLSSPDNNSPVKSISHVWNWFTDKSRYSYVTYESWKRLHAVFDGWIQWKSYMQCNDEKRDDFKGCWPGIKNFLRSSKMLEVRYLSNAVNAAAASYAKNTIKMKYWV